jgi:hypothetical protein
MTKAWSVVIGLPSGDLDSGITLDSQPAHREQTENEHYRAPSSPQRPFDEGDRVVGTGHRDRSGDAHIGTPDKWWWSGGFQQCRMGLDDYVGRVGGEQEEDNRQQRNTNACDDSSPSEGYPGAAHK